MTMPAQITHPDFIVGRSYHPGYALPLALHGLAEDPPAGRLCIVYLSGGSAVMPGPGGSSLAVAPSIALCAAPIGMRPNGGAEGRVLSFTPDIVNGELTMRLLEQAEPLHGTTEQDAYLLRPFLDAAIAGRPLALEPQLNSAVRQTFERIEREAEAQFDQHWPCRTRSYLIELLFRLRLAVDRAPAEHVRPETLMDRALPLIRERLHEKLTVEDLAHLCGTNRSSLNAAFRAATGHSIRAYIIQLRIGMAATLLRDTGLPVAEIMARVGYENASHFGRQFKTLLGAGPRAYRDRESTMPGRRRA